MIETITNNQFRFHFKMLKLLHNSSKLHKNQIADSVNIKFMIGKQNVESMYM